MQVISDFFSQEQLNQLVSNSILQDTLTKTHNHNFNVDIDDETRATINSKFGLQISQNSIPARLIVGDIPAHADNSPSDFEHTYIIYLNDSEGQFLIDGHAYPIVANTAFKFSEGVKHEVAGSRGSKRLVLGPMNEKAEPVGLPGISADGETDIIYISYNSSTGLFYRINTGDLQALYFPIGIYNTNTAFTLKVLFETDITLTSAGEYFIPGTDNIQFGSETLNSNGSRPIITLSGITDYPGLISNGAEFSDGYRIRICNLVIASSGSTIAQGAGYLAQSYFSRGTGDGSTGVASQIVNCSSDGPISTEGGGIVGSYAAAFGDTTPGTLTIVGCTSSGSISPSGGGIVGLYAGQGIVFIRGCSSSGNISNSAGGIAGALAINVQVSNSYSTGPSTDATGVNYGGGGIFGRNASNIGGTTRATNCYSIGSIGQRCGGIYGQAASGNSLAINCYTVGVIGTDGGGIYGLAYVSELAFNCYTSGAYAGGSTNGIYSGSASVASDCYAEANNGTSGWNTVNAAATLTDISIIWTEIAPSTPYLLTDMGTSPYNLTNINFDASGNILITSAASTVVAGNQTSAAVIANYTYQLLGSPTTGITINSTTGSIVVSASVPANTYILTVYSYINPYSITTYTLSVISPPAPSFGCCGTLANQKNLDYEVINKVRGGNALIAGAENPRSKFVSYQDMIRFKTAAAFSR